MLKSISSCGGPGFTPPLAAAGKRFAHYGDRVLGLIFAEITLTYGFPFGASQEWENAGNMARFLERHAVADLVSLPPAQPLGGMNDHTKSTILEAVVGEAVFSKWCDSRLPREVAFRLVAQVCSGLSDESSARFMADFSLLYGEEESCAGGHFLPNAHALEDGAQARYSQTGTSFGVTSTLDSRSETEDESPVEVAVPLKFATRNKEFVAADIDHGSMAADGVRLAVDLVTSVENADEELLNDQVKELDESGSDVSDPALLATGVITSSETTLDVVEVAEADGIALDEGFSDIACGDTSVFIADHHTVDVTTEGVEMIHQYSTEEVVVGIVALPESGVELDHDSPITVVSVIEGDDETDDFRSEDTPTDRPPNTPFSVRHLAQI